MDKQLRHRFAEYAGWYGVAAILFAYVLGIFQILPVDAVAYQVLNLTGAVGLVWEAIGSRDAQPLVLNLVWALVALLALLQPLISSL